MENNSKTNKTLKIPNTQKINFNSIGIIALYILVSLFNIATNNKLIEKLYSYPIPNPHKICLIKLKNKLIIIK